MELARNWRLKQQRYRLEGAQCAHCRQRFFPPRPVCPECGGRDMRPYTFKGRGKLYSYSTVYQAPQGFESYAPYVVGLVGLEEGPLVTAQVCDVDPSELRVGMPLEMVTRKLFEQGGDGLIVYGYKFRPPLRAGGGNGHREVEELPQTVPQAAPHKAVTVR